MSSLGFRKRVAVGMAIVLAGAAAIMIVVLGSTTRATAAAATIEPSPGALSHYAVFRRGAVASDALPAVNLAQALAFGGALTRRAPTTYALYSQWATLEGDNLCVVTRFTPTSSPNGAPDTSSACGSVTSLEDNNQLILQASLMGGTSSTPPTPGLADVISGLAPDGVAAVTLRFTDGSRQRVAVEENTFIYSLGDSAKIVASAEWTGASGAAFHQ